MMSPIPRGAGATLTAASALLIALVTLVPNQDTARHAWCVICGEVGGIDAVLNVALFVPLGVGLALLGMRGGAAIAIACAGSIAIELLQRTLIGGRSATLSDVLTNTAGAALGFWIATHLQTVVRPTPPTAAKLAIVAAFAWLGMQAIAAFSILPSMPEPPHRAQIGRGLADTYQPFPGQLLSARVDDRDLGAERLPPERTFHELALREGSVGEILGILNVCPYRPAALIHAGDSRYRELFILAALNRHAIFGVRTGAEALRLGPIRYRLPDAFGARTGCTGPGDTTQLSVQYTRTQVTLSARHSGGDSLTARHQPHLSQAWGLFVPFLWYRDGGPLERVLDIAWAVALVLPGAFWAGGAGAGRPRDRASAIGACLVTLATGFVVVPLAFGVAIPSVLDWVAVIVAGAVAWMAGARRSKA